LHTYHDLLSAKIEQSSLINTQNVCKIRLVVKTSSKLSINVSMKQFDQT